MHYIVGLARPADVLIKAHGLARNEYRLIQRWGDVQGLRFVEGDTLTHVWVPGDWKAIHPRISRELRWAVAKSGFRPPRLQAPDSSGGMPWKCTFCGQGFEHSHFLDHHEVDQHGVH